MKCNTDITYRDVNWSQFINRIIPLVIEIKRSPLRIIYDLELEDRKYQIMKHGIIIKCGGSDNMEEYILSCNIGIDGVKQFHHQSIYYVYFYTCDFRTGSWILDYPCKDCFYDEEERVDNELSLFIHHKYERITPFIFTNVV